MGFQGKWEPGFQYNYGDIVTYEGLNFIIIQPHRSQSDWTPPITPALWGRTNDGGHKEEPFCQPPPCDYKPKSNQYDGYKNHEQEHEQAPVGYTAPGGVEVTHEETKKPWYDLDDDKKKKLEIGGGLTAGLALLGGAYYAHKKHAEKEEDREQDAWALQNWVIDARSRAEFFFKNGPSGPVTWIFHDALPQHPELKELLIVGGQHQGSPWYISRAQHDGSLIPGMLLPRIGAILGHKKEAVQVKQYEVLIGKQSSVQWVKASGRFEIRNLGFQPVECGRDENQQELFFIRSSYKGEILGGHVGKEGAYVTYEDDAVSVKEYEVLCLRR